MQYSFYPYIDSLRGRPHMISHLWVGGYVLENLISPIKNELYTSEKSDMGGWVGQKWPKKSDIICGWPLIITIKHVFAFWDNLH